MHPKKGLAIFIGLLGILSLVIGSVLVFLTADFVPWPECPLSTIAISGSGAKLQVYFLRKQAGTWENASREVKQTWYCTYRDASGNTWTYSSERAYGDATYLNKDLPKFGEPISVYITFDLNNELVEWKEGDFGQTPWGLRLDGYAENVDLTAFGYGPYIPPAYLTNAEEYHFLWLPDGRIAQYIKTDPNNTSI